jgi:hypothetical protein
MSSSGRGLDPGEPGRETFEVVDAVFDADETVYELPVLGLGGTSSSSAWSKYPTSSSFSAVTSKDSELLALDEIEGRSRGSVCGT